MKKTLRNMTPVHPAKPVAPYLGGKRVLAGRLVERFNAIEHSRYVEVFVGMGGPFFKRDLRPKMEVINDISKDITTLFRILQRHLPQFIETLKYQLAGHTYRSGARSAIPVSSADGFWWHGP